MVQCRNNKHRTLLASVSGSPNSYRQIPCRTKHSSAVNDKVRNELIIFPGEIIYADIII